MSDDETRTPRTTPAPLPAAADDAIDVDLDDAIEAIRGASRGESGADVAKAYVPPTAVPSSRSGAAIETQRVKIADQADPRRAKTVRREQVFADDAVAARVQIAPGIDPRRARTVRRDALATEELEPASRREAPRPGQVHRPMRDELGGAVPRAPDSLAAMSAPIGRAPSSSDPRQAGGSGPSVAIWAAAGIAILLAIGVSFALLSRADAPPRAPSSAQG